MRHRRHLDALERLFQRPVLKRLFFHHIVCGIGTLQRVPVDLADRTPVGAHLRHQSRRQRDLAEAFEYVLAVDVARGVVIEDEHQAGKPRQRGRAQMSQVRNPGHLYLYRDRDLALDFFGAAAGPLGDDLDVVIGHIGIRFDRQIAERNDSPRRHNQNAAENQPAVCQCEINKCAKHLLVPRSFKQQRVVDHLLAGLKAGKNFLSVAFDHFAGANFNTLELVVAGGHIHPVAVMQVKNGVGRNDRER